MRAIDHPSDLNEFLARYEYQPKLTVALDRLGDVRFTHEIVNEIVLWKINRYVRVDPRTLEQLDGLRAMVNGQHRQSDLVLESLLAIRGIDLALASTFLRFRNPDVFQIIDRHAYRAVHGRSYSLYSSSPIQAKVKVYYDYLDHLLELCKERNSSFSSIDRLLYEFDRQLNGPLA